MADTAHYVIRGGLEGRERLRVLARVMKPYSNGLLDRLGAIDGHACLDVGCGGGDVTLDLARRVAPHGHVVGVDLDEVKLRLAREEAVLQDVTNVQFRLLDIRQEPLPATFDIVYARFLLTHLSDPASAVRTFYAHLKPGGRVAVEDIDFTGHFSHPDLPALHRYMDLYSATVRKRGGDPNIGPRLASLLMDAGFADVDVHVVQPVGRVGEAKLVSPLTMENIADAVLADGLATVAEIESIVNDLYAFAADPKTVAAMPRIVQAWGTKR